MPKNTKQLQKRILEMKQKIAERKQEIKEEKDNKDLGLAHLMETEFEQVELILTAESMVSQLQDMAEDIAKIQVEGMMPLVDDIKGAFSPEQAQKFESTVNEQLQSCLDTIRSSREAVTNAILGLKGQDVPDIGKEDGDFNDIEDSGLGDDLGGDDLGGDLGGDDLGMDDEIPGDIPDGDVPPPPDANTEFGRVRKD